MGFKNSSQRKAVMARLRFKLRRHYFSEPAGTLPKLNDQESKLLKRIIKKQERERENIRIMGF